MKRALEFAGFTALAIGAHLAVFLYSPLTEGEAMASGAGGQEEVTLYAVAGDLNAIVEDWMAPPEVETALDEIVAPPEQEPTLRDRLREVQAEFSRPIQPPIPTLAVPSKPALPSIDNQSFERPKPAPKPKAAPKPKPTTPVRPQVRKKPASPASRQGQRAAGSGGGQKAGQSGNSRAPSLSKGAEKRLVAKWGSKVRARILRKKSFPRGASGSGTVRLRIIVAQSGQLVGVSVVRSSGSAAFDKAALRAVRAAGRFPGAPKGLRKARYTFTLNMQFG